jgi:SSS family solute:Na+ symporter
MFGLNWIDIIVIVAYFSVVLWIGFRAMKRIKNEEDYFLAGRRFGKYIQTFAAFGQGTSAETAVGTTTVVSRNGAAGVGFWLVQGLLSMPVFWMVTMWYRRLRYLSLAQFFEERYNSKAMAGFYAVTQALMFMIVAAAGFTAMSKTVAAIAIKPESVLTQEQVAERDMAVTLEALRARDYALLSEAQQAELKTLSDQNPQRIFSYINRNYLTVMLAIVVLVYAICGGLGAAFVADMVQGIFIIILTLILVPFAMHAINLQYGTSGILGTFQAFHQNLPQSFFKVLGSPNVPQFTWYYLLSFGIMGVFNTTVQSNQLTAAGSAKDDETARVGFVTGMFMKRYCTVIWGFVAMMTLLLYGTKVSDPDFVWGMATRDLLCPGLVGLMVACLMAALLSTVDALMLTSSSLLTNNFYRPLFPGRKESHYVLVGRIFCLVYIVGGVFLAITLEDVFTLLIFLLSFNSMVAASFWVGMIWRRATRTGAWVSIIITSLFTLILPVMIPIFPGVRTNEYLAKQTQAYTVENSYIANSVDVQLREEEIEKWDALSAIGKAQGNRPKAIAIGEDFIKYDYIKSGSIFWQKGLTHDESGLAEGGGMLKVELVIMDLMGIDLAENKYALNESFAYILRVLIPFSVVIVVSRCTRREDTDRLDFFYGRLRTPAISDHAQDAIEVQKTKENPKRFDHLKMFENSNWEFRKWTKRDWKGHGYIAMAIGGVIFIMYLLVTLGK